MTESSTLKPQADASVVAAEPCYHCQLPLPDNEIVDGLIDGESKQFCCQGCRSVAETIHNAGLGGFYERILEGEQLAPPPELTDALAMYDLDEVQQEFVSSGQDSSEVHLLVEGVHCAACVWLIENSLRRQPGIEEARVNLSGRKLKVLWDRSRLPLSRMLELLGTLGYKAVPYDPNSAEDSFKKQNRHLLFRMGFAAFAMMNLMWISIALYTGADQGEFRGLFHWVGLALATPTLIYSGYPFFRGAWFSIRNLSPNMDLPIAIGVSITYLYSAYVTFTGSVVGEVYFDTVVNFLFVILVGRYLEAMSKRKALASTQRLLDLQPKVATRLKPGVDGDEAELVAIRAVKKGDRVLVKPGERIPVDGVVLEGSSQLDEAMLTGESIPVTKSVGAQVNTGTLNGSGTLVIKVTGLLGESALGQIIHLVEDAQSSRAPIQRLADRIVPWFVMVTLSLALASFIWWWGAGIEQALMVATSVLIITCPCALGMATPMSIAVASGLGARHGILVKNGEVLERLSAIRHFVFDKTGTLTEGQMQLSALVTEQQSWQPGQSDPLHETTAALLKRVAEIERLSEHPIASAIVRCAEQQELKPRAISAEQFSSHPGQGVIGIVDGQRWLIGTPDWLRQQQVQPSETLEQAAAEMDQRGISSIRAACDGQELALIAIEDRIRDGAKALIEWLKAQGAEITLLSGDRRQTAEAVADQLGGMEVIAEVLPQDKDRTIAEIQARGHEVVMVGDGVNDAPSLVRADVGIALGSGTDVSIASADIVLLSNDLARVDQAAQLSQRTLRTVRQNIGLSFAYNSIMVPLAMMGLVTPLVAAITMPISSLLVIGNAARISTLFRRK
ncbi:heavy metal translocating P-type ATPase [Motiliproteus sp.]|uniref:heavy metal translocating P-type ATPase n=1 Tax=Motiliproteus sp. TaxID=1898955 RepID=UPI003BAA45F5